MHGFRTRLDWMGEKVETLADLRPSPGGILLVGVNPAPLSVAAGHYYQGRLGQRLWARLASLGLLPAGDGWEDERFQRDGNGLTDLVKRPTASAKDVSTHELRYGTQLLLAKIGEWKPKLVLFPFRPPAERLLGKGVEPGPCGEVGDASAFLFNGPYSKTEDSARIDAELVAQLGG